MSSFNSPIAKVLCLSLFGLLLYVASPARADDDTAMIRDVHNQLKQASAATTDADREGFLKSALDTLHNLPAPDSKKENQARKHAASYIKSALFELGKGDPDHKVDDYIRDADEQVRDLEK
jgi:hypothetical protein